LTGSQACSHTDLYNMIMTRAGEGGVTTEVNRPTGYPTTAAPVCNNHPSEPVKSCIADNPVNVYGIAVGDLNNDTTWRGRDNARCNPEECEWTMPLS
jgi:hypothetical protein